MTSEPTTQVGAETELYLPVKEFLEDQGFTVKSEVRSCDVVAVRGDEPPVIVELKRRFNLELVLQAVDRLAMTDMVYVGVPFPARGAKGPTPLDSSVKKLCRRIGIGILLIDPARDPGRRVEVALDPQPYQPRRDMKRLKRLLGEHRRRAGDPNMGGLTRRPIITAYRQDALRLAALLLDGPRSTRELRERGAPAGFAPILQRDVYGWFTRVERGVYTLSDKGREESRRFTVEGLPVQANPSRDVDM